MKIRPFILAALIASTTLAYSQSAVPAFINYQGRVADASGNLLGSPVAVNRTVTIRVYDHASASAPANLLYSEQQTATINGGEFSILIGAGAAVGTEPKPTLDTIFTGNMRYIGVTVDDGTAAVDTEISPRQQLTTNPFSMRAKVAESALVASNLVQGSGTQSALTVSSLGYTSQNISMTGTVDGTSPNILASAASGAITTTLPSNGELKELVFTKTDNTPNIVTVNPPGGGGGTINGGSAPVLLKYRGDSVTIRNVGGNAWWIVSQLQSGAITADSAGLVAIPGTLNVTGASTLGYVEASGINVAGGSIIVGVGGIFSGGKISAGGAVHARGGSPGASGVNNNGYAFDGNGGDSDSGMFSLGDGQVNFFTQNAERMRINDLGGIGIGTSNPGATVHVIRNSAVGENEALRLEVPGQSNFTQFYRGTNGDHYIRAGTNATPANRGHIYLQDVVNAGNVSIGGQDAQRARLTVYGSASKDNGAFALYSKDVNGVYFSTSSGQVNTGIYADNRIVAPEFNALSDARIKTIKGISSSSEDLKTIMGVEVTDYFYRDALAKGTVPQKKLIAQQVEKVFPQAVLKSTDIVPDIMKKADMEDGWIVLATDLKKGEKVRLISDKDVDQVCEVLEVKADRFRTSLESTNAAVFVYGRQVNDFRTVDYDAIAMLNVSATQEIKKASDTAEEALRKENAELRAKVTELEKTLASTAQATEARFAAIEASLRKAPSGTAATKPDQDVTPASISTRQ